MKTSEILNSITSPNAATRKAAAKSLKASQRPTTPLNYAALTLAEKKELLELVKKCEMIKKGKEIDWLVNFDTLPLNERERAQELLNKAKDGANGN